MTPSVVAAILKENSPLIITGLSPGDGQVYRLFAAARVKPKLTPNRRIRVVFITVLLLFCE